MKASGESVRKESHIMRGGKGIITNYYMLRVKEKGLNDERGSLTTLKTSFHVCQPKKHCYVKATQGEKTVEIMGHALVLD